MGILQPGTQKGSEYSFGSGRFKDPRSDFQSQRSDLPFPQGEDENDLLMEYRAQQRLDATNPQENVLPNMLYVEGNPDAFGPGPALVTEPPNLPKGTHAQPFYRYGVNRQG
jgi:hypothetical protein